MKNNTNYKFFNTLSVSVKVSAISGIGIGEYLSISIGIGGNFVIVAALLLCPASGMNTRNIQYLMCQVERVSFQQMMAELVRAPIPRSIQIRKLLCVRLNPDSDTHLSLKKTFVTTVVFQSIHVLPRNRTSLPSLHLY